MKDLSKAITDIMSNKPVCIQADDHLHKAESIFNEFGFHHILVVDHGKLSGILSTNDLIRHLGHEGAETKVKDIMTANPLTIQADDSIGLAADIFLANKLHALPILEDDDLVGIVTTHDLLKYSYK